MKKPTCPTCGLTKQCTTCGAYDQEREKFIVQCSNCDGERYYYQLQRWRDAALKGQEALRPRWWERLLGRPRALPSAFDEAIRLALELEREQG